MQEPSELWYVSPGLETLCQLDAVPDLEALQENDEWWELVQSWATQAGVNDPKAADVSFWLTAGQFAQYFRTDAKEFLSGLEEYFPADTWTREGDNVIATAAEHTFTDEGTDSWQDLDVTQLVIALRERLDGESEKSASLTDKVAELCSAKIGDTETLTYFFNYCREWSTAQPAPLSPWGIATDDQRLQFIRDYRRLYPQANENAIEAAINQAITEWEWDENWINSNLASRESKISAYLEFLASEANKQAIGLNVSAASSVTKDELITTVTSIAPHIMADLRSQIPDLDERIAKNPRFLEKIEKEFANRLARLAATGDSAASQ